MPIWVLVILGIVAVAFDMWLLVDLGRERPSFETVSDWQPEATDKTVSEFMAEIAADHNRKIDEQRSASGSCCHLPCPRHTPPDRL